jgi:hypothetical protein
VITKYLDNIDESCYGVVTGRHITQESATTKNETGLDLFHFLAGLPHVAILFFLAEIDAERFFSHRLPHFPDFFFLAGATRGNFCAERTLTYCAVPLRVASEPSAHFSNSQLQAHTSSPVHR